MGRFSPRVWVQVRRVCGLALLLAGAGLLMSCGRGSFIGRQYDDLTAYYNAFYNANQAFDAGLESVTESGGDIDRTRYLSVFPPPQGGAGQSSFEEAIQKSADVLREHPNSEWVDDALLLIGRSRYYQQNYVGAVQKFREVIALGAEREGEARFRLAQTLVAADRYPEAAEALRAGLDQAEDYGSWTARMRVVRGELLVRQESWEAAEQALVQGLNGNVPDDTGARAAFLLGQVRETLEDPEGARLAYRRVLEYDPPYPLSFAAQLGAIEMEGRNGNAEQALERLGGLERDDNTRAMRAEIARVRARLYRMQGRPDRAKQVLAEVLRGDGAPRGAGGGRTHYELATLYRDTYEDFTRAAAHFDTAATSLSSGGERGTGDGEAQALPRAPSDAEAQADRFRRLADRSRAVARMDSLLRLGRMAPAEFQSVVEKMRQRRMEEREAEARRTREQPRFRGERRPRAPRDASTASPDQSAVQTQGSDAGFLFHRDPALVQQGRRQFEQTWGNRPLTDDWRRAEAIRGRQETRPRAEQTEQEAGPESSADPSTTASVVDVSAVPRDSASQAEMEDQRAVARYELANALYRNANRPDSAETWYIKVLGEDWDHPVAKQALYGLAQAHRAQNDSTAAAEALHYVVQEYPSTPYAKRAHQQLGLEPVESATSPGTGTKADSAYAQAYAAWRSGAHDAALNAFLTVADTYRETGVAPRALLAAGVVYHRSVRHDSSGQGRARFVRYADSLAQAGDPGPPSDTTSGSFQDAAPSAPQSPESGGSTRARPADTTDQTEASRPANPAAPDTADADAPEGPPRRVLDSTAVTRQGSADPPSDRAATPARAPGDTAARAERPRPPDTTASDVTEGTATPDSAGAASQSQNAPMGSFEVLLSHLADRYPETPEAERAQALLAQLREQRTAQEGAPADSTSTEPQARRRDRRSPETGASEADTLTTDDRAPRGGAADSLGRPQRRDSSAPPAREATPVRVDSSRRPSLPDTSSGG